MPAQADHPNQAQPANRRRPAFSTRVLAVFGVTLTFLTMMASGLAIYVAPRGRIANATDWSLGGLSRQGWETLHATTSLLFIGFAVWHLLEHASVYRNLLLGSAMHRGHATEAAIAVLVVGAVLVAAVNGWPPASWIADLNMVFKDGYLAQQN